MAPFTTYRPGIRRLFRNHPAGDWRVFAIASGAALAASTNTQADLIYKEFSVPLVIGPNSPVTFGMNSHSTTVVNPVVANIARFTSGTRNTVTARFIGAGVAASTRVRFYTRGTPFAAVKYAKSQPIGGTGKLLSYSGILARATKSGATTGDFKAGADSGYLGFRTKNGDTGWIKLQISFSGSPAHASSISIISFAYSSLPITAGQTISVPEPGSMALGLLAAGASGLIALRRAKFHSTHADLPSL